jgi:hypothetical protein
VPPDRVDPTTLPPQRFACHQYVIPRIDGDRTYARESNDDLSYIEQFRGGTTLANGRQANLFQQSPL